MRGGAAIAFIGVAAAGLWLWLRQSSYTHNIPPAPSLPAGIRRNNPGNLRVGNNWEGETVGATGAFESFQTRAAGLRALGITLLNYYRNYRLNTVRKIINRYAPPSENPTDEYVNFVAQRLNVTPDRPVNFTNDYWLGQLMRAIVDFENGDAGKYVTQAEINHGVQLAHGRAQLTGGTFA